MPGLRKTRRRQLSGPTAYMRGYEYNLDGSIRISYQKQEARFPGRQITVSEGHQWPPPKKADLIDRGGMFYTTRSELVSPRVMPVSKFKSINSISGRRRDFTGSVLPNIPGLDWFGTAELAYSRQVPYPPTMESSDSALETAGVTAISRCQPTNPVANLSTALGELMKDGLPSLVGHTLWKERTRQSMKRNAAGEYLNVQFAWQPLLSDVSDLAKAIKKSDEIIAQYERDAGRVVRRKYYFPSTKNETRATVSSNVYPMGGGSIPALASNVPAGNVVRTRVVEQKRWFSGAFTYHLPSGYESRNGIVRLRQQSQILFGTDVSPELLWNLAPWSWAADWFSNTGDVIHNLQQFKANGLIMRYGYLMEETSTTDTYTHEVAGKPDPRVAPVVIKTTTKKRVPANPFGFGVKWEGLSTFQLSIAAALGLSRSR